MLALPPRVPHDSTGSAIPKEPYKRVVDVEGIRGLLQATHHRIVGNGIQSQNVHEVEASAEGCSRVPFEISQHSSSTPTPSQARENHARGRQLIGGRRRRGAGSAAHLKYRFEQSQLEGGQPTTRGRSASRAAGSHRIPSGPRRHRRPSSGTSSPDCQFFGRARLGRGASARG